MKAIRSAHHRSLRGRDAARRGVRCATPLSPGGDALPRAPLPGDTVMPAAGTARRPADRHAHAGTIGTTLPWRRLCLSPRVVVPVVFGLGLIIFLLGYADVGRVLRALSAFHPLFLLLIVALTLGYEGFRAAQWLLVLRTLDRRVSWQGAVMAYLGGEVTKSLPAGQYFQTYLLRAAEGVPVARSAAATTIIIWLEAVLCLSIVLLIGVGPWQWVRPLCLLLLAGIALLAIGIRRRPFARRLGRITRHHARLHAAWAWGYDLSLNAATLLRGRVLLPAAALSLGYLGCAALAFWAIVAALGVPGIGPLQALLCYAFALGVGLVIPIPLDLGLTEVGGVTVLMALGVNAADALAIMLIQRVLSSLLTLGSAAAGLALMRRRVRRALRPQAGAP